jgi:hypothetical protein
MVGQWMSCASNAIVRARRRGDLARVCVAATALDLV